MNLRSSFLAGFTVLAVAAPAVAAPSEATLPPGPVQPAQSTNAPPVTPAPPQANAKSAPGAASPNGANGVTPAGKAVTKAPNTPNPATSAPAAPAPAVAAKAPEPVLETYMSALADQLKLTADEKKEIQTYYLEDGPALEKILNDSSLSPLQQDQQVSDLRDARNTKITSLLGDVDRTQAFFQVESQYRVALIDSAAEGGLLPAQPAP